MLTTALSHFPNVKRPLLFLSMPCLFLLAVLVFYVLIFKVGMLTGFVSPSCLSAAEVHVETFDMLTAVPDCWLIR